jgi:hypothetical protein
MDIKIIDDSKIKKANKVRDESLKEYCKEADKSKIKFIKVIRNSSNEIVMWQVHYK